MLSPNAVMGIRDMAKQNFHERPATNTLTIRYWNALICRDIINSSIHSFLCIATVKFNGKKLRCGVCIVVLLSFRVFLWFSIHLDSTNFIRGIWTRRLDTLNALARSFHSVKHIHFMRKWLQKCVYNVIPFCRSNEK